MEELFKQYITNTFVLNPPKCDYSKIESFKNEIIYITKNQDNAIPCLFIQDLDQCSKFLIIFHGNNEDIFESEVLAIFFRDYLKMNILVVEYPGYSIYKSEKDPKVILSDSIFVYDWVKEKFNAEDENIYIYGRSIGSAPAIYLASKRNAKALFVVSGFSSLKNVGKSLYVGWAIEDIFKNIDLITQVKIPTLFIHGQQDKLINIENSKELFNKCGAEIKDKKWIDNMNHNEYDPIKDIFNNIKEFLTEKVKDEEAKMQFYNLYDKKFEDMFIIPKNIESYLDGINFQLNEYEEDQNFRFSQRQINDIILLKDERIAIVFEKEIEICDTLFFNKYYCISMDNKIIFVNQLRNGNLLICDYNGYINFFKLELTKKDFLFKWPMSKQVINFCKVIELNNNNLISIHTDYYPLNQYKKKESGEYEVETIEIFQNTVFDDIIELPENQIVLLSNSNQLLVTYDFNTEKIKNQIEIENENFQLFSLDKNKIVLLGNNKFYIYNIYVETKLKEILFFQVSYYKSFCFSVYGPQIYLTYIIWYNSQWLLLGDNRGYLIKCYYKDISEQSVEIEKQNFLSIGAEPIKKILILPDKRLLTLNSTNNLKLINKKINSSKSCNIF